VWRLNEDTVTQIKSNSLFPGYLRMKKMYRLAFREVQRLTGLMEMRPVLERKKWCSIALSLRHARIPLTRRGTWKFQFK
jgi:hypothetical protein